MASVVQLVRVLFYAYFASPLMESGLKRIRSLALVRRSPSPVVARGFEVTSVAVSGSTLLSHGCSQSIAGDLPFHVSSCLCA